jgi:hypothetical protein
MSTLEEEWEQARKLGRRINRDARSNPNSPYARKVVGIRRGEVVIVADTLAVRSLAHTQYTLRR